MKESTSTLFGTTPMITERIPAYSPSRKFTDDPFEVISDDSAPLIGHIIGGNEEIDKSREKSNKNGNLKKQRISNMTTYTRDNKRVYAAGDYDPYYKNRYSRYVEIDPRLEILINFFKNNFFKNKKILNIGCGYGLIDFYIAAYLGAAQVVGLDISFRRIMDNIKQLRKFKHDGILEETNFDRDGHYPSILVKRTGTVCVTNKIWRIKDDFRYLESDREIVDDETGKEKAIISHQLPKSFPFNIEFRNEDFLKTRMETFDAVFCLNVCKYFPTDQLDDLRNRLTGSVGSCGYLIMENVSSEIVRGLTNENFLIIKRLEKLIIFQKIK